MFQQSQTRLNKPNIIDHVTLSVPRTQLELHVQLLSCSMAFCRRCGDIVSGPRCNKCGGASVGMLASSSLI